MKRHGHGRLLSLVACVIAVVLLASWAQRPLSTVATGVGLANPGFESGVSGGLPASWTSTRPDAVKVVPTEGPSQFSVYANQGITVSPNRGDLMLRLGTPRNNTFTDFDHFWGDLQPIGTNRVSQTFTSDASSLQFAFRLFSWESRDRDVFRFDLRTSAGSVGSLTEPLVVAMPDGSTRSCTGIPCQFDLDVGQWGQFLDSGWRTVHIVNVPVGVPLTLTYGAGGSGDIAQGTWAYFDSVGTTPVAKFSFTPEDPLEGSFIQLTDESFDPDPGDTIVGWDWTIDGDTTTSQNPFAILPNEGTYVVALTVTSSDGTTSTVSTGETAGDGTPISPLVVSNASPVAGPLNIETLAGQDAPLLARFADPGWEDTHTTTWSVAGGTTAESKSEDNLPALNTGVASATAHVSTSATGTFTVSDNGGGSVSQDFNVNVVPDDPQRFEPNGSIDGAPTLAAGGSYLSYIQSDGDVDIYQVVLPDNSELPAGSEVLLTLRNLPADYDLVALSESPTGPDVSRFAQSDFGQIGFDDARFAQSRFAQSRFAQSRFAQSRFAQSRFAQSSFRLANVPLSGMSFTGLDGEQIGGTDISLEELGLGSIGGQNVNVAGFSANRGLGDETVLARTSVNGTKIYVAVIGANGARSAQPYRIQVEASVPFDLATMLGSEACTGTPLVSGAQATSDVQVLYHNPTATKTLFVTQRERMRTLNNMDDASWNALQADLVALAQHPSVQGDIISLPSDIYDDWDRNPCDIDAADAVSGSVFSIIQSRLTGVENVVLVGDDDIVPYKRVPDETIISNERDYALDSFLKAGSPELASILLGYNLSDDYYVDALPSSWQGRDLYVPDLAIGRLVETPDQIRGAAQAFVASNGVLNPSTAFVSGYDFFGDGAQAMADNLSAGSLSTRTLISDGWTADDLRCKFLNQAIGSTTGCAVSDISGVNAHFTHYAALSANGFSSSNFNDVLTSKDVATAGGATPTLLGKIVFSMGCHAGLSVPNRASLGADAGLNIDPSLDFAEAMALQRAVYIASTGFGLGDDEGIGGTEKLMTLYAQDLVRGDVAAGAALVSAKQRYVGGLASMTVYDEKSTIQTVFYGLPMYRVHTNAPTRNTSTEVQTNSVSITSTTSTTVTIDDGGPITTTANVAQVDTPSGSYFTTDGDAQATAGRPVQPRIVLPLEPSDAGPVHGVAIQGGTYSDIPDFDPVISRPTNEWESGATEPQTCLSSFWPADVGVVNTLETLGALKQTLVVTPGQFECDSGDAATVTGLQRLYPSLSLQMLRCNDDDFTPPVIHGIDIHPVVGGATLTVDATDPSGIVRIVVLRVTGGVMTPTTLDILEGTSGPFVIDLDGVTTGDSLVVQVQDAACNVSVTTGKGATLNLVDVDGGPDQTLVSPAPNAFPVHIQNFASLSGDISVLWDFGDGSFVNNAITAADVTIDGGGTATFTVTHAYHATTSSPITASVKVTDANGGIGTDEVAVTCDGSVNNDGNKIELSPFYTPNDLTRVNSDALGDSCDPDNDNDGILDTTEADLSALQVICPTASATTDPKKLDTDGDGVTDGAECALDPDPASAASVPAAPAPGTDADVDGLSDAFEASIGTNSHSKDTDGDGLQDRWEVKGYGSDPLVADTDGDGLADSCEAASLNADTVVNVGDQALLGAEIVRTRGTGLRPLPNFDLTKDGVVNPGDQAFQASRVFLGGCPNIHPWP